MKLKQRIILGFLMIILVPMLLLAAALYGFSEAQHRNSARNDTIQEAGYDITIGETDGSDLGVRIMTKDPVFYGTDYSDIYQCVCRTLDIQKCSHSTGKTAESHAEYQGWQS